MAINYAGSKLLIAADPAWLNVMFERGIEAAGGPGELVRLVTLLLMERLTMGLEILTFWMFCCMPELARPYLLLVVGWLPVTLFWGA